MSAGSIQWLTPFYALVMLFVAVIAMYLAKRFKHRLMLDAQPFNQRQTFKHPLFDLIPKKEAAIKKSSRWLQHLLLIWMSSLFAIALAQPILIGKKLNDLPPERDIVLLVDTSISMTLKDYEYQGTKVSRLAVLKSLLSDFVKGLKGERLGMIVFAEKPYLLVPLTRDQALIQQQLQRLTSSIAGRVSALGDAIILGLKEAKKNPQRKQIFVLFTDVDQSIGRVTPDAAAELALRSGIPLYSIAIGSTVDRLIDAKNDANNKTGNKNKLKIEQGGLLYQSVNLDLLKQISKKTAGKTFEAADVSAIKRALAEINQQQKNQAEQLARYEKTPLYYYFLIAAILPLLLMQLFYSVLSASVSRSTELSS